MFYVCRYWTNALYELLTCMRMDELPRSLGKFRRLKVVRTRGALASKLLTLVPTLSAVRINLATEDFLRFWKTNPKIKTNIHPIRFPFAFSYEQCMPEDWTHFDHIPVNCVTSCGEAQWRSIHRGVSSLTICIGMYTTIQFADCSVTVSLFQGETKTVTIPPNNVRSIFISMPKFPTSTLMGDISCAFPRVTNLELMVSGGVWPNTLICTNLRRVKSLHATSRMPYFPKLESIKSTVISICSSDRWDVHTNLTRIDAFEVRPDVNTTVLPKLPPNLRELRVRHWGKDYRLPNSVEIWPPQLETVWMDTEFFARAGTSLTNLTSLRTIKLTGWDGHWGQTAPHEKAVCDELFAKCRSLTEIGPLTQPQTYE